MSSKKCPQCTGSGIISTKTKKKCKGASAGASPTLDDNKYTNPGAVDEASSAINALRGRAGTKTVKNNIQMDQE